MQITQVRGNDLTSGMTMRLADDSTAAVLDAYPAAGGRVIWVELSNGESGAVSPYGCFEIVTGP
jgi:hypothetical protein